MSMELSTGRATARSGSEVALAGGGVVSASGAPRVAFADFAWAAPCAFLVLAYIAAGYAVAGPHGLPIHWPGGYLFGQAKKILLVVYTPLVLAYLADSIFGPRARAGYPKSLLLSPRFLIELFLAIVLVHATIMMFVNLKQFIPALNPALYDSPLWRLDAWLHFGFEPAARVSDWAGEHGWMDLLDQAYVLFFPAQLALPILFLISRRLRPDRGRFFFAFCLLWMAGGLVYVLWPSLGPCYYRPSRFVWLDDAPYARHLQMTLIQDYVRFRGDPAYYDAKLSHGVAALPSMHVGVLAFFALATWGRFRALSAALWALTAVTFVGSLALAWHYAIDGYAGLLLGAIAWWIAGRVVAPDENRGDAPRLSAVPREGEAG
jgi:hypothetical protein